MRLITDPDDAADEIELIVSMMAQVDELEDHEVVAIYRNVSGRIERLLAMLLTDEATLRREGYGLNVPIALSAIDRTRTVLLRLQRAVDAGLRVA